MVKEIKPWTFSAGVLLILVGLLLGLGLNLFSILIFQRSIPFTSFFYQERKGVFLTDKEDKKSHGLGISSVREVVEKYEGTLDISYREDEFRVVVLIKI